MSAVSRFTQGIVDVAATAVKTAEPASIGSGRTLLDELAEAVALQVGHPVSTDSVGSSVHLVLERQRMSVAIENAANQVNRLLGRAESRLPERDLIGGVTARQLQLDRSTREVVEDMMAAVARNV